MRKLKIKTEGMDLYMLHGTAFLRGAPLGGMDKVIFVSLYEESCLDAMGKVADYWRERGHNDEGDEVFPHLYIEVPGGYCYEYSIEKIPFEELQVLDLGAAPAAIKLKDYEPSHNTR